MSGGGEPADPINHVVVLPGDGIGPEVCRSAVEVSRSAARRAGVELVLSEYPAGEASIEECGAPLSSEALEAVRSADAVLLGAVGGREPPPPGAPRPEDAVLGLRVELDAYANLRPAACPPALAGISALRAELTSGVDVLLVREATAGPFFAQPRELRVVDGVREAIDTWRYDEPTVRRVVEKACDLAAARRGHLTSVDKANVLCTAGLWRAVASEVAGERVDLRFQHMLVDNAAAQLVGAPGQFDVIVTENLFGDILSDLFGGVVGSLGMLPSATIGDGVGLFEPVHGSAPDIAGAGIANPYGAIASAAMMFRFALDRPAVADAIDAALAGALAAGARTPDIAGSEDESVGTVAFTDGVLEALERGHEAVMA